MTIVVDASVVVKFLIKELLSDEASRLLESDEALIAPAHFLGEVGEVLMRRMRAGQIAPQQLHDAATLAMQSVTVVPLEGVFEAAVSVASEARVSFYDALYVAVAELLDTIVVTADARLVGHVDRTRWSRRVVALPLWTPSVPRIQ